MKKRALRCPECEAKFDEHEALRAHREAVHPEAALATSRLEAALRKAAFPMTHEELVRFAADAPRAIAALVEKLPPGPYRDAAEVARALEREGDDDEGDD